MCQMRSALSMKKGELTFILREYKSPFLSTIEILRQIGITHISESAFSKLYIEIRNLSGHVCAWVWVGNRRPLVKVRKDV